MSARPARIGVLYGLSAYLTWGMAPAFWKLLLDVGTDEILVHRVLWGALVFVLFAWAKRRLPAVRAGLGDPRTRRLLAASALLLACNWGTFIYAVNTGRVMHASLGYFVNPLVSVLLGVVFLQERLRPAQWIAVGLATTGVVLFAMQTHGVPWISLVLATSFGLYGLLRKVATIEPLPGSTIEALLLLPIAVLYGGWLFTQGATQVRHANTTQLGLLLVSGPVTALPLLWFANAASRVRLSTLGFLQYVTPTGHFLLAVFAYDEPFGHAKLTSFVFIWAALLLFVAESWRRTHPQAAPT